MKIKKVTLRNIKSFTESVTIQFGPNPVNTLSGINGAGKSTFLKMIWLVQKSHYVLKGSSHEDIDELQAELSKYISKTTSFFRVTFEYFGKELTLELKIPKGNKAVNLLYSDEVAVDEMWPITSPKNIILLIDASKGFSDDTLLFNEIDIAGNDQQSLLTTAIRNPSRLFSGVYRQLVKDWAHARLIPGKPNRLFYFQVAARLFNHLIPNVIVSNFSGSHKPREFVLLGKSAKGPSSALYDVREFSSGEKALLSTLTFLCVTKSVSVFLIDEPENHFHESLLLQLVSLLNDLCQDNGFVTIVEKIPDPKRAKKPSKIGSQEEEQDDFGRKLDNEQLRTAYGGTALSQVILSTHSKSLIYKVFSWGQNYLVDKTIEELKYDGVEFKLREIGLSSTYSKVLLVEGVTDSEALQSVFSEDYIKVKSLNGSDAVIESFKRLAELKDYIHSSRFVFLVDSDNKPNEFFEKLAKINQEFYDQTFIKLSAHELENLLLNPSLFVTAFFKYNELTGNDVSKFSEKYIQKILERCAEESLPTVYKKEISLHFIQSIERHFANLIWGNKAFDWKDTATVETQLLLALSGPKTNELNKALVDESKRVFEKYSNIDKVDLLSRCDGKQVLGKVCHILSLESKMKIGDLKAAVYKAAREDSTSPVGQLIDNIRSRLN